MTLAEKILSLRTERGMSQDDLAEKLTTFLNNWIQCFR